MNRFERAASITVDTICGHKKRDAKRVVDGSKTNPFGPESGIWRWHAGQSNVPRCARDLHGDSRAKSGHESLLVGPHLLSAQTGGLCDRPDHGIHL